MSSHVHNFYRDSWHDAAIAVCSECSQTAQGMQDEINHLREELLAKAASAEVLHKANVELGERVGELRGLLAEGCRPGASIDTCPHCAYLRRRLAEHAPALPACEHYNLSDSGTWCYDCRTIVTDSLPTGSQTPHPDSTSGED